MHSGGWQIAAIEAAPARTGVTDPLAPAGIVVGEVDTYSSDRPVRLTLFWSTAVTCSACGLFSFTTTGLVVAPGVVRVIDVGGQVEMKPAELAASATFAVIRTDPGWLAVATPFWSMLTTDEIFVVDTAPCTVYCKCPA